MPTHPARNMSRRAWLCAGAPIVVLVALLAVLIVASLQNIARREDEVFRAVTRRAVASAMTGRAQATADVTLEYANWDAAYAAITQRWDARWLSENFYSSVVDALIVFRDGQMRYLWTPEMLRPSRGALARDALTAARRIEGLEALAAAPAAAGTTTWATMQFRGELALIAIVPVTLEDSRARLASLADQRAQDFLLSVQVFHQADIDALGRALELEGFRFVTPPSAPAEDSVFLPMSELRGEAGVGLVWRDDKPGSAALAGRIRLALIALFVAGVIAILGARALIERLLLRAEAAPA
jgi:hypothetical protein